MTNEQTEFTIEPEELEIGLLPETEIEGEVPALDASADLTIAADAELMKGIHAIPQKMAFKIGEAAEMVGVKQYVLRYWESEFDLLRPRKSPNGQRVYSRKDVETAMMIKKLLYNDRFSIEGARTALRQLKATVKSVVAEEKTTEKLVKSQENVVHGIQSLLEDIRRARSAFLET